MPPLELKGIIPATILPMSADFKPDFNAFQAYLEWLLDQHPVALAINMDTGEGPQLSPEERRQTLETTSSVVRGRCPILAGVMGGSTLDAVENAITAKAAGADGLVIFPNAAFRNTPLDPEIPYQHHKAIAEPTGLPMVLFQLASIFGGVLYPREVLLKLLEIPQVIALKESSFNAEVFAQTRETLDLADRPITLLTGHDRFIIGSFLLGADGALLGYGAVACNILAEMIRTFHADQIKKALAMKPILQGLADFLFRDPMLDYRARCKAALACIGVITREQIHVRPPMLPVDDLEYDRTQDALLKAGFSA